MKAKKILFITQELVPYVPEAYISCLGRDLPQAMHETGREVRTFSPKWGHINERRNQLHEVIRLSGINIIIDDTDYPLIIKVASIPVTRLQVYFIDNDCYFQKSLVACDETGKEYTNNAERAIFYARGVLETMKKVRWTPDIVHCHGWISALCPIYIKTAYCDEPTFRDAKIAFSLYDNELTLPLPENFKECMQFKVTTTKLLESQGLLFKEPQDLLKLAIKFSDGVIEAGQAVDKKLLKYAKEQNVPVLKQSLLQENYKEAYGNFYDSLIDTP